MWAVCFPTVQSSEARRLWRVPDVEVCEQPDFIWLRGSSSDEELEPLLRGLCRGRRFQVVDGGQLQPPHSLLPRGYLPEGPWIPLQQWMRVELPPAGLAGQPPPGVALNMVRSGDQQPAGFLLTDRHAWRAYGAWAAEARLQPLTFAAAADGRLLVRGQPLPSLPGRRYADRAGLAVPAGWAWSPPVDADVVRAALRLAPGDVALLETTGSWQRIPSTCLVRADRQSIRRSSAAADA